MSQNTSKKDKAPAPKKHWEISIRFAFASLTALFLSLSGLFTIILSYQGNRSAILDVTSRLMTEISLNISTQTQIYFGSSVEALKDFENGTHTLDLLKKPLAPESILDYLYSITEIHRELSAIYFGEEKTGNFYMTRRMSDDSISKRTIVQTKKDITISWEHKNPEKYTNQFPLEQVFTLEEGYDPRKRPWYKEAITVDDFIWTDPYIFHSDSSVGISVAKKIFLDREAHGESFEGVVGADFTLSTISTFLEEIDVLSKMKTGSSSVQTGTEKDYHIFLMNQDHSILATSDKNTPTFYTFTNENGDEEYKFYKVEDIPNELITESFNQVEASTGTASKKFNLLEKLRDLNIKTLLQGGDPNKLKSLNSRILNVVNFDLFAEPYLASLDEFSPSSDIILKVGIIFKENLVTGPVSQTLNFTLFISAFLIIIVIVVSLRILANITKPIIDLARDMEKVKTFEIDFNSQVNKKQNFLREIDNMNTSYNSMKNGLNSFKKFVPSEVVSKLVKLGKEAHVGGERLDISVFFSDIAKFTVISEETPSEQLIAQLRYYLNILSKSIGEKNGTLDKYIGDSIMAFWGAPATDKNHAFNACSAAIHCQKLSQKINKNFRKAGLYPMYTRIGIHTGPAIVGNIGSDVRLNYTAIGDTVNLANRLEALNKLYNTKIIISEKTHASVRKVFLSRLLDKVAVYGEKGSIAAYELIDFADNVSQPDKDFYNLFNEGAQLYFNKNWDEAIRAFSSCLTQREDDGPSQVLLNRCNYYSKKSFNMENWNGVFSRVNH